MLLNLLRRRRRHHHEVNLNHILWRPSLLRGFVCDYHPAALGSNPMHTIYAFSNCIIEIVTRKERK